ncbi:MAG: hypothetical protein RIE53_09150 [Rhodothermales bacterium]
MSRTYSQDEVTAILKEAYRLADGTERENQGPGLTLAELETMAVEHGLDAATIRAAAAKLDSASGPETFRTYAGVRWRVGHRAVMNGPLSDAQWAAIVSDCRHQFNARGEQSMEGNHRVWRNGNLFVSAEPSIDGTRTVLHMGSRNDTIPGLIGGGLGPLVMALMFLTMAFGVDPDFIVIGGIMAPIGLLLTGAGILHGRNWIQDRERQMALIADRAIARSGTGLGASETLQERLAPESRDLLKDLDASSGSEFESESDSETLSDSAPRQRSRE